MKYFYYLAYFFTTSLFANEPKEVLLIHSYHKGYSWSDDISKLLKKILQNIKT